MNEAIHDSVILQETKHCDTHDLTYPVQLDSSGEQIAGHCPKCIEREASGQEHQIDTLELEIQNMRNAWESVKASKPSYRTLVTVTALPIAAFSVSVSGICSWLYDVPFIMASLFGIFFLEAIVAMYAIYQSVQMRNLQSLLEELERQKQALLETAKK